MKRWTTIRDRSPAADAALGVRLRKFDPTAIYMLTTSLAQSHNIVQDRQTTANPSTDAFQEEEVSCAVNCGALGGLLTLGTRNKALPTELFNAIAGDLSPRDKVSLMRTSKATAGKLDELMKHIRDSVPKKNELVQKIADCKDLTEVDALIGVRTDPGSIVSLPVDSQVQPLRALVCLLTAHPDDPHQLRAICSTTDAICNLPTSLTETNFPELGKVYQNALKRLDTGDHEQGWQLFRSAHTAFKMVPKIRTVGTFTACKISIRGLAPENRFVAFNMLLAIRHLGTKSSEGVALRQLSFTIDSFPEEHFLDALDTLIEAGRNHSTQVLLRMLSDGLLDSVCSIEHPVLISDDLRISGYKRILDAAFTLSKEDWHRKGPFGESSLSERLHETANRLPEHAGSSAVAKLESFESPDMVITER
ncbi:hypothetical protein [Burkholderia cepacia]|uniref:hypothetical protein n=1 Tax=Burkholderia cepacia TaxID=292 RepID=UPI00158ECD06|nr:hypothetical protein [Burkholderia cepacia]